MADNTRLSAGTSDGDTMRDLDRAGIKTTIVALDLNPAGAETLMAGAMPVAGNVGVTGSVAVTGTFWQATQPVSGTLTVAQATAANLKVDLSGTAANLVALKVDGSGVTQPVSGTVTVVDSVPLTTSAAQSGTWNIGTVTTLTGISTNVTVIGTGTFAVQAAQSGTWNVGTVTTVATVTAVTAITNALPAGTNLLGQVAAAQQTNQVYNGTTALTPKFAAITASASGATTVVAAVSGKKIRVLKWSLSSNGTVNMKWQSHVTPTDLTGLHYMTQFASAGGAYSPVGHFETVAGEALDINLSAAVAVGGELTYVEV